MNSYIVLLILILLACLGLVMIQSPKEGFRNNDYHYLMRDPNATRDIVTRPPIQVKWGPYLWGNRPRTFYDYGPQTSIPVPYENDCNEYALEKCRQSCDPSCYKGHYYQCSATRSGDKK